jgi:hypothetical protein
VTDLAAIYPDDLAYGVLARTFVRGRMELLPLSQAPTSAPGAAPVDSSTTPKSKR